MAKNDHCAQPKMPNLKRTPAFYMRGYGKLQLSWCFSISLLSIKNMADHSWSFSWGLTIQYFAHFFVIQLAVHWGMEAVSDAFLLM